MNRFTKSKLPLVALAVALSAGIAYASTPAKLYVQDSDGRAVRDSFGKCVLDPVGGKKLAECDGPVETEMDIITLGTEVFFDVDKSYLTPQSRARLDALARDISKLGKNVTGIAVIGNTDSTGNAAYNMGLSERRAESVTRYLVNRGVNPNLIEMRADGESDPIASNTTSAGRAKNRRVDIAVQAAQEVERFIK